MDPTLPAGTPSFWTLAHCLVRPTLILAPLPLLTYCGLLQSPEELVGLGIDGKCPQGAFPTARRPSITRLGSPRAGRWHGGWALLTERVLLHVPAPSAVPRASPGCPHHSLVPGIGMGWGNRGAPPGEEGTELGRVFPGRLGPGKVPALLQGVILLHWPNKAFPMLPAWCISPQHRCGPGWQPRGPQLGQATGRASCPKHRDGGRSQAPRVPTHTGTQQPPRDVPIGVRR